MIGTGRRLLQIQTSSNVWVTTGSFPFQPWLNHVRMYQMHLVNQAVNKSTEGDVLHRNAGEPVPVSSLMQYGWQMYQVPIVEPWETDCRLHMWECKAQHVSDRGCLSDEYNRGPRNTPVGQSQVPIQGPSSPAMRSLPGLKAWWTKATAPSPHYQLDQLASEWVLERQLKPLLRLTPWAPAFLHPNNPVLRAKTKAVFFFAGAVRAWSSDGHQSFRLDCPFPRMRI